MKVVFRLSCLFILIIAMAIVAKAQVDEICGEFGASPSISPPSASPPVVFGKVFLNGFDPAKKPPSVTVILVDRQQSGNRLRLESSGNYCFKRTNTTSGTLVIEVDGIEVGRRTLAISGPAQQREDFEISPTNHNRAAPPGTVSGKFPYTPIDANKDLYRKVVDADQRKDAKAAISSLKQIVANDPADFPAWAKLGLIHLDRNELAESEAAFRKALAVKVEYTPGWINMGRIRLEQKQYPAAIEILKHAVTLEPDSALIHQLLGEAYLLARQGSLGAEALNKAIELDPKGMAEVHLQLAHLYQLAGAKDMAVAEYKAFLTKVPEHPDKKKFEKYIADNPKE